MKKQPLFYKSGVPKISPGQVTTGTSASTTDPSDHTFKDTLSAGLNVASWLIPGGAVVKGAKALSKVFGLARGANKVTKATNTVSKVPSYLNQLNKKFPSGSNTMKKHYDDVRDGITQIKPTVNQSGSPFNTHHGSGPLEPIPPARVNLRSVKAQRVRNRQDKKTARVLKQQIKKDEVEQERERGKYERSLIKQGKKKN